MDIVQRLMHTPLLMHAADMQTALPECLILASVYLFTVIVSVTIHKCAKPSIFTASVAKMWPGESVIHCLTLSLFAITPCANCSIVHAP